MANWNIKAEIGLLCQCNVSNVTINFIAIKLLFIEKLGCLNLKLLTNKMSFRIITQKCIYE